MKYDIETYKTVVQEHVEDLNYFLTSLQKNPEKFSRTGPIVFGKYYFLAISDYSLYHDIIGFREKLSASASYRETLFQKRKAGESIDDSFVSMHSFQHVLKALAADNYDLAKSFVSYMGGNEELELKHDHPFDNRKAWLNHLVCLGVF